LAERPARFFLAEDTAVEPARTRREPVGEGERPRRPDGPPAAQLLRLLEEPEVRTKLGLTSDQEQKINALQEKARQINLEIREQVHEKLKAEARPDMTPEEREALRRRAAQAMEEAMRGARDRLEPLVNEGEKILTEEQITKLKDLARDRVKADMATGGLAALLTPKVQQELGLSAEQVEKIKAVVQDLHAQAEKLRDEVLGPGKEPAPEDLRGEKGGTLRRRHGEMVRNAREKVMDLLTPEQREKVEQAEKRMAERRGTMRPAGRPEAPPPTRGYNSPI
jgi:hypothetical protein